MDLLHVVYIFEGCRLFFFSQTLGLKQTVENNYGDVISVKVRRLCRLKPFLFIFSLIKHAFALFMKLLRCLNNI